MLAGPSSSSSFLSFAQPPPLGTPSFGGTGTSIFGMGGLGGSNVAPQQPGAGLLSGAAPPGAGVTVAPVTAPAPQDDRLWDLFEQVDDDDFLSRTPLVITTKPRPRKRNVDPQRRWLFAVAPEQVEDFASVSPAPSWCWAEEAPGAVHWSLGSSEEDVGGRMRIKQSDADGLIVGPWDDTAAPVVPSSLAVHLESPQAPSSAASIISARSPQLSVLARAAPPALIPTLAREGYSSEPSMQVLSTYTEHRLSQVEDFKVLNSKFGWIQWPGLSDLRGLDLDAIIDINHLEVSVYHDRAPPIGTGFNKLALVCLFNCKPRFEDRRSLESLTAAEREKHMEKIRNYTERMGARFLCLSEYWEWRFEVPHFSRYRLDAEVLVVPSAAAAVCGPAQAITAAPPLSLWARPLVPPSPPMRPGASALLPIQPDRQIAVERRTILRAERAAPYARPPSKIEEESKMSAAERRFFLIPESASAEVSPSEAPLEAARITALPPVIPFSAHLVDSSSSCSSPPSLLSSPSYSPAELISTLRGAADIFLRRAFRPCLSASGLLVAPQGGSTLSLIRLSCLSAGEFAEGSGTAYEAFAAPLSPGSASVVPSSFHPSPPPLPPPPFFPSTTSPLVPLAAYHSGCAAVGLHTAQEEKKTARELAQAWVPGNRAAPPVSLWFENSPPRVSVDGHVRGSSPTGESYVPLPSLLTPTALYCTVPASSLLSGEGDTSSVRTGGERPQARLAALRANGGEVVRVRRGIPPDLLHRQVRGVFDAVKARVDRGDAASSAEDVWRLLAHELEVSGDHLRKFNGDIPPPVAGRLGARGFLYSYYNAAYYHETLMLLYDTLHGRRNKPVQYDNKQIGEDNNWTGDSSTSSSALQSSVVSSSICSSSSSLFPSCPSSSGTEIWVCGCARAWRSALGWLERVNARTLTRWVVTQWTRGETRGEEEEEERRLTIVKHLLSAGMIETSVEMLLGCRRRVRPLLLLLLANLRDAQTALQGKDVGAGVYGMLAGRMSWRCLDWRHRLRMFAYQRGLQEAVRSYEDVVFSGERVESPLPLSPYLESGHTLDDTCAHKMDMQFNILRLLSGCIPFDLHYFDVYTNTPYSLDFSTTWPVVTVLTLALGLNPGWALHRLHRHYAAQLEQLGMWHWACFLHILTAVQETEDAVYRKSFARRAVEEVVSRHCTPTISYEAQFARDALGVPAYYFYAAQALERCSATRFEEAAALYERAQSSAAVGCPADGLFVKVLGDMHGEDALRFAAEAQRCLRRKRCVRRPQTVQGPMDLERILDNVCR